MTMVKAKHDVAVLEKCPTGIRGLDEIAKGGLPRGRPTLICGGAGSGKTLFAMEFLMRGAMDYGEPGVFMTFEETPADLAKNFISLGFQCRYHSGRTSPAFSLVERPRHDGHRYGGKRGQAPDTLRARRICGGLGDLPRFSHRRANFN